MWRKDDGAHRTRALGMARRPAAARHMPCPVALRSFGRIYLAMVTRRPHRRLADRGAHALGAQAQGTLVKPPQVKLRELPDSRGYTCPIANSSHSNCIDKFSENAIKVPEGPRAGVGLAGLSGSQS
jgi:hypothetical protein